MSANSIINGASGGRLYIPSLATCWQDDAGTTSAAVDSPVGRIVDHAGNNPLTASGSARPTLRLDGSAYYLEFSGAQVMTCATSGITQGNDYARGALVYFTADQWAKVWVAGNSFYTANGMHTATAAIFTDKLSTRWSDVQNTGQENVLPASSNKNSKTHITGLKRGSNWLSRENAVQYDTRSAQAWGDPIEYSCLGSLPGGGDYFSGRVYSFWSVNAALTDGQLSEIENDLGTQAGASWVSSGATSAITATTANAVGSLTSQASPLSSIAATTANLTAAWTSSTGAASSAITATTANTVGALTSTGSTGNGTFTSEVLRDNTGTVVASKALNHVALYNDTTGALVVRKTGLSTNGSGVFTFTDAAITAGTTYRVDWEDVDGRRRMPRKAAT